MADPQDLRGGNDIRPIPDPTVLTTAASVRLEEVLRNLIKTETEHQYVLFNEKIVKIEMMFTMLDARTAEQKSDTKAALDAALAAQKEAVASQTASFKENITKSETAATERIKGVETLLATSSRSTDDKISDLKDRVIAIEAIKLGNTEGAATVRQSTSNTQAVITAIVGVALVLTAIVSIAITLLKP